MAASVNSLVVSIIVVGLLPLLMAEVSRRFWTELGIVRLAKSLGMAVAVAGVLRVVYQLFFARSVNGQDLNQILLLVAHLPPLISLFVVSWTIRTAQKDQARATDKDTGFLPRPHNSEIEKLDWSDLVIQSEVEKELKTVVELLKRPEIACEYGIDTPKGILLYGPPGTGKTTIAKVMANQAELSFFVLKSDEVISKYVGESEKNLSKLFATAQEHAPAVIFIDEIESLGGKRAAANTQWSDKVINHLLQLIDGVLRVNGVYVIGATNRRDLVDTALLRSGRLSRSIEIPLPDEVARQKLLKLYTAKLNLEESIDIAALAAQLDGRSPADIKEFCNRAGLQAFQREAGSKNKSFTVTRGDLFRAMQIVNQR